MVLRAMMQVGVSTYKDKNISGDTWVHQKPCVRFWVRSLMKQASRISASGFDKMREKLSKQKQGDKKNQEKDEANFFTYLLSPDLWVLTLSNHIRLLVLTHSIGRQETHECEDNGLGPARDDRGDTDTVHSRADT